MASPPTQSATTQKNTLGGTSPSTPLHSGTPSPRQPGPPSPGASQKEPGGREEVGGGWGGKGCGGKEGSSKCLEGRGGDRAKMETFVLLPFVPCFIIIFVEIEANVLSQKVWSPGLRRTYRTFSPPPLHAEDPHPTRRYLDPKVWVPVSSLMRSETPVLWAECEIIIPAIFRQNNTDWYPKELF